jgi:DNA-binding CsgD family transcriptional regulator
MHSSHLAALNYNRTINEHIKKINTPLVNKCGLSLLTFRRFSNTDGLLYIFNNNAWMEYSFLNNCWNSNSFENRITQLSNQKFLNYIWPDFPDSHDPVYCALYDHNIWNGVIMYRKYDDCIEAFAFAAEKESDILKKFYVDGINILNDYIIYFKDKAHSLIHPTDKNVFIPYNINLPTYSTIPKDNIKNFFKQTRITKYFLSVKDRDVPMSKREIECLFYLSKGKTMKEIGLLLKLSPRTIESYLNNAKIKSGLSAEKLCEAFLKSNFITNNFYKLMEMENES